MKVFTIFLSKKSVFSGIIFSTVLLLITGSVIKMWSGPARATMAPVYQGSAREKKISLTFNVVWGEEYVPQILDYLRENDVTATFFLGGQWVDDYPELARQIAACHEVGNHGYSHLHQERLTKQANIEEIKKAETSIVKATGIKTNLFAPPYGERGDVIIKAAEEAGYITILWSIDTIDWQRPDPSVVVSRVTDRAHNGAIVLMHPTAPTVHALPQIIKELKRQGYKLVKVSTLIEDLKKEENAENKTGSQNTEYRIQK